MTSKIPGDRAGLSYWNDSWGRSPAPRASNPSAAGRWNFPNRKIEELLRSQLGSIRGSGRLLELGCARSIWLPYFARTLGYRVTGLDYSEIGCEQTRQMLHSSGVAGEVLCADFFNPPESLLSSFDVVFSYGVAEHFDDTSACIADFSRYLAPGGLLVTLIPNVNGLPGFLQKHLNKDVFDKHVPVTRTELELAHRKADLAIENAGYLVSVNFGVLNLQGLAPGTASLRVKRAFLTSLCRLSLVAWYIDEYITPLPLTELLAAYVYCAARKT